MVTYTPKLYNYAAPFQTFECFLLVYRTWHQMGVTVLNHDRYIGHICHDLMTDTTS